MANSNTWKCTVAVAAGLVLGVTGVTWINGTTGISAQRKGAGGLSTDDRAEIMHVYASYARYFDLPDVDPDEFVKRVWTSDAEFVNITVKPKSGQCPGKADNPPGDWKPGTLDMIKGSIPDKLGMTENICIGVVRGYQEMALRAKRNYSTVGAVHRTRVGNHFIEKTPQGAHGLATVNFWDGDESGGKWNGSGIYEEDFVKTADGWRIRKRVFHGDGVLTKWKATGSRLIPVR
jgi:hypothetical protein